MLTGNLRYFTGSDKHILETISAIGKSVAQSNSTRSQKIKLSTIECGHQMDGECNVLGFAPAVRFLQSLILCRLYKKSFGWEDKLRSPMCKHMQKGHMRWLKILQSITEFGGLWKHPINPACTKIVKSS